MRPFPLPSVFGLAPSARERRTILIGLAVIAAALASVYGIRPLARHWLTRERTIATQQERLARLRGLVSSEARLREIVSERSTVLASGPQRLLSGRTPALAASALQSLIQGFADQSQVTVSRLDVAGAPVAETGSLPMIPANVSAIGDIYGITELLSLLQRGSLLLEITELSVRPNPALRGELLQLNVSLRGAYLGS
jgi:type II secretion system (T2SS) protein M